jgi:predicted nucleic acid-binding protein
VRRGSMAATVLDSSSLIAFLREEVGSEAVQRMLERAAERDVVVLMTELSYTDVQCSIRKNEGDNAWETIARKLPALPIEFCMADRRLSDLAANLRSKHGLSLINAFAAALAKSRKGELVTGNDELRAVEKEIKIVWLK